MKIPQVLFAPFCFLRLNTGFNKNTFPLEACFAQFLHTLQKWVEIHRSIRWFSLYGSAKNVVDKVMRLCFN